MLSSYHVKVKGLRKKQNNTNLNINGKVDKLNSYFSTPRAVKLADLNRAIWLVKRAVDILGMDHSRAMAIFSRVFYVSMKNNKNCIDQAYQVQI